MILSSSPSSSIFGLLRLSIKTSYKSLSNRPYKKKRETLTFSKRFLDNILKVNAPLHLFF